MVKNILIIDDSEQKIKRTVYALKEVFKDDNNELDIDTAITTNKGCLRLAKKAYDFVFIDMVIPDSSMCGANSLGGIRVLKFLANNSSLNSDNIKYIMNSAGEDTLDKLKDAGFEHIGIIFNNSGLGINNQVKKFIDTGLSEDEHLVLDRRRNKNKSNIEKLINSIGSCN